MLENTLSIGSMAWLPSSFQQTDLDKRSIRSLVTDNVFFIGSLIGAGAFGVVYECTDVWDNKLAIKVLRPIQKQVQAERAVREAITQRLSGHPNIVHVHECLIIENCYCLISEFCDTTLYDLNQVPDFIPALFFRSLSKCLLQGIHVIHNQGLVHCDIHAGNVFLHVRQDELMPKELQAATFKLGDFGLARPIGEVCPESTFLDCIRPPETIHPEEFGCSGRGVDVYQVGLLLLDLMHGFELRLGQEDLLSGRPQQIALTYNDPVFDVVAKMLRRHVEYRYQSAMEAWNDLRTALDCDPNWVSRHSNII